MFGSCIWIVASWISLVGPTPPLQPTSTSYAPAIRMMVQSMLLLTVIGWPLIRLSTWHGGRPWISTLYDTVALVVLWQIVLWPLRLVTHWPVERMVTIDVEAIASCVLVGGVVTLATVAPRGRAAAMVALLCWSVILPAVFSRFDGPSWLEGPFLRSWRETGLGPGPVARDAWHPAAATLLVGIVAWSIGISAHRRFGGDSTGTSLS